MGFFRTLIGSFYDETTYHSVQHEKGCGLRYSFFLSALSAAIFTLWAVITIHQFFFTAPDGKVPRLENALHQIIRQLPVMTFDKGQLQTQHPKANFIALHLGDGKRYIFATIDTTGATTPDTSSTPILITAQELVVIDKDSGKTEIHALEHYMPKQRGPLVINQALLTDMADALLNRLQNLWSGIYLLIGSLMLLVVLAVWYIARVAMLLALATVALLVANSLLGLKMNYPTCLRFAAVSYTPVAMIALLAWMISWHAAGTLALFASGVVMLTAAIYVCRDAPLAAAT